MLSLKTLALNLLKHVFFFFYFCKEKDPVRTFPCQPSPCGPNSQCREVNNQAVCTCLPDMLGAPPNCRPECSFVQDCPPSRTCISGRCVDPCVGACGNNALCTVHNHVPNCECISSQYKGDPYSGCVYEGKCLFKRIILLPVIIFEPVNIYFGIFFINFFDFLYL